MVEEAHLLDRVLAVAGAASAPDAPWWRQPWMILLAALVGVLGSLVGTAIYRRLAWLLDPQDL
jgi:hypothetical protein